MQTSISQAEISSLSTGALHALIRDLENGIAFEQNPALRARGQDALRLVRAEIARRQHCFAPKPPGF